MKGLNDAWGEKGIANSVELVPLPPLSYTLGLGTLDQFISIIKSIAPASVHTKFFFSIEREYSSNSLLRERQRKNEMLQLL